MSPNMKLSLLALVGAAAAVPQYNVHSKFHHKSSGYAGPTGGWAHVNATGVAPSGTAAGTGSLPSGTGVASEEGTTTSTTTIFSTIFATKPHSGAAAASSVIAADVSPAASECGPATVYVTATNKVTVTVSAGGAGAPSSYAPAAPSSVVAEGHHGPPGGYPVASSKAVVESSVVAAPPAVPSTDAAPSVAASSYVAPPVKSSAAAAPPAESSYVAPPVAESSYVAPPVKSSAVAAPPAESSYVAAPPASSAVEATSSAAASAAPSSAPGGGYAGGKRGIAYRWDGAAGAKTYENSKMGFAWNWESDTKGDIGKLNFIPTLRTKANTGDWLEKVAAAVKTGSTVVFGLNEPDNAGQAALSVTEACKTWTDFMNPIATDHPDVTIVGPSVSSNVDPAAGLGYLAQFKKECPGAIWHQANIHWYGQASAGFTAFKAHIDDAISQFGKVWVSEFSLDPNSSLEDSTAFLKDAIDYLDKNDDVVGYSYFAVGDFDPTFNLLGTADAPTECGKIYNA